MKKKIVVYTVLFNNYDTLKSLPHKFNNVDYICFTNIKKLQSKFWNIKYLNRYNGKIITDRFVKFKPSIFLKKYSSSIYIDANVILLADPLKLVNMYLNRSDIVLFQHRFRNTVIEEYDYIKKKYNLNKILIKKILKSKNNFLSENRVIMRNHNTKKIIQLMNLWWKYFENGVIRDQLSLPFACRNAKVKPFIIKKKLSHLGFYSVSNHSKSTKLMKIKMFFKFGIINFSLFSFFVIQYSLKSYFQKKL